MLIKFEIIINFNEILFEINVKTFSIKELIVQFARTFHKQPNEIIKAIRLLTFYIIK